jgi:hypothetical protein
MGSHYGRDERPGRLDWLNGMGIHACCWLLRLGTGMPGGLNISLTTDTRVETRA